MVPSSKTRVPHNQDTDTDSQDTEHFITTRVPHIPFIPIATYCPTPNPSLDPGNHKYPPNFYNIFISGMLI